MERSFNFDLKDKRKPELVIEEALKEIEKATKGYVIGNIESYEGRIYSYTTSLSTSLSMLQEKHVDIQENLGEIKPEQHKFEVFLRAKDLPMYKYRMMFIKYDTVSYPVSVVMNEKLANEYSGTTKTVYSIERESDLQDLIESVLNSDTLIKIIQSLIDESIRVEHSDISKREF